MEIFNKINSILQSKIATIKLMLINKGVNVDADSLYKEIKNYPHNFRTKRAKKRTVMFENKLVDIEKEDFLFIPKEFYIIDPKSGRKSVVKLNSNEESIFKMYAEDGKIFIISQELNVKLNVELLDNQIYMDTIIDGSTLEKYIPIIGESRIAVMGFEGCEGFFHGTSCLFCDSITQRICDDSTIPTMNDLYNKFNNDIKQWFSHVEERYTKNLIEAYKIILENSKNKLDFFHMMAGNLSDLKEEWDYIFRITEKFNEVYEIKNFTSYLNLLPIDNQEYLVKAKELGYKNILYNLEVYGEKFYNAICKGKSDLISYKDFIKNLKLSAKITGNGNTRCGFVFGAQPIDIMKEGVIELAENGIATDFTVFTPKKGTPWENKKRPDIFEAAEFSKFVCDTYKKYNFKPLYSCNSLRSSVMNEVYYDNI